MSIKRVLAQAAVTDIERAIQWYSNLFDSEPDARPMDGLVEWRLGESFGVQLWSSPDRAGQSTLVLEETDLDLLASHLDDVGLGRPEIEKVTASRLLQLEDPDGNRVIVTGV